MDIWDPLPSSPPIASQWLYLSTCFHYAMFVSQHQLCYVNENILYTATNVHTVCIIYRPAYVLLYLWAIVFKLKL